MGMLKTCLRLITGEVGAKNSLNRDQWVRDQLSRLDPGSRMLDVGAGEMRYKDFCGHLDYVSQDFGEYDGLGDGAALQTGTWDTGKIDIISDVLDIPEPDESFDAILCTEVFEHLPRPHEAVREFARLLRPGGKVLLTAPVCSLTHFAPYYFANGFSKYWYKYWLEEFGFKIIELSPNGNYLEYIAQELRRLPSILRGHGGAGIVCTGLAAALSLFLLRLIKKPALADKTSWELLSQGLHVLCVKES